jgi:tetrahydromethanopterin S-methyltransferase subunit B
VAQEGRFIMERTEDGIVRLDTFTGELSACSAAEGQMVCRMAADERRALEEQIDLLEERIAAMEKAITEAPTKPGDGLPSNEEIDRTFGMMEQMMRRFLGIIEEFDQDGDANPDSVPGPEKTRS